MAYNQNIPQPTDQLSQSQGDILANFQAIKTLIDVNHEDFASVSAGNHKQVIFTDQTANLPISVTGTQLGMYNALFATTAVQELFIKTAGGITVPFTATAGNSAGFTFLPSGIVLQWGVNTLTGLDSVTFSIPFPTNCFIAFANVVSNSLTYNAAVAVNNFNDTTLNLNVTNRTTTGSTTAIVNWLALGS